MAIQQQLKDFGLSPTEIKAYMALLTGGLMTALQLQKETGVSRPNLYPVLESLTKKGLITYHEKGRRKSYLTKDPDAFVQQLELRKKTMKALLPDLRAMRKTIPTKPSIQFYEGVDAVKDLFTEMLSCEEKVIYGVASTQKLFDAFGHDFFRWWGKKMNKAKITLYDLLSPDSVENASQLATSNIQSYYEFKGLPAEFGEIAADYLVWDDKVALISIEEPIFATVVDNAAIAETMKILCKTAWRGAKG